MPIPLRCLGCDHFRSDASYLPELKGHLDKLLRDRARVLAGTDLEPWAREEAMPSDEEVSKLRALIRRVERSMDNLSAEDRSLVQEAITAVRASRRAVAVSLGMPQVRASDAEFSMERP